MTNKEHQKRHVELHQAIDELVGDYLAHNLEAVPSKIPVMELLVWSKEQCENPTGLHRSNPNAVTFVTLMGEYLMRLRKRTEEE